MNQSIGMNECLFCKFCKVVISDVRATSEDGQLLYEDQSGYYFCVDCVWEHVAECKVVKAEVMA